METLLIKVEDIEQVRQPWSRELSEAFLGEALVQASGWAVRSGARLDTRLTKMGANVLVEAELKVPVSSPCRRCLTTVETDLPVSFTLTFVARPESIVLAGGKTVAGKLGGKAGGKASAGHRNRNGLIGSRPEDDSGEGENAGTFDLTEADEEPFDGETIDLGPVVREQVLLALPSPEPLCQEECPGLCPVCGHELSSGDCGHDKRTPDPRLAGLRNIKLN